MTISCPSRLNIESEKRRGMLRAQLVNELAHEGVHLALPATLCGIDLLAYTPPRANAVVTAVPIQLVVMSHDAVWREFAALRTSGLLVIFLENTQEAQGVRTFALTAPELMLVQMVGLIDATATGQRTSRSKVSALRQALEPYAMVSGNWHAKLDAGFRIGNRPTAR
jgi:hypothetical protein